MNDAKAAEKDFVWVIVEEQGEETNILGLTNDVGESFIPATRLKEEGLMLMGRMPARQGVSRQLEAMHQERVLAEAAKDGFEVYVVDQEGKLHERLGADKPRQ